MNTLTPTQGPQIQWTEGSLPQATMVTVIGDGLAALWIAAGVAATGADVVVLAPASRLGSAYEGGSMGLVTPGLIEHPHRLVAALGTDGARQIYRWTRDNAQRLQERAYLETRPLIVASAGPGEHDDIRADLACLPTLDQKAGTLRASETMHHTTAKKLGEGWRTDQSTGVLSPRPCLDALAREALSAGAKIFSKQTPIRIEESDTGLFIHHAAGRLQSEIIVLAGDWRMRDALAWCADKVSPVRHHFISTRSLPEGLTHPCALSTQHGWLRARIELDGSVTMTGARWASPHFEFGEDTHAVSPDVEVALQRLLADRFPSQYALGGSHTWTAIAAHTCDNLPIVGPLPGRSRVVACFGWNSQPWSLAARAADAVVEGLTSGRAADVPLWLRAHRFV